MVLGHNNHEKETFRRLCEVLAYNNGNNHQLLNKDGAQHQNNQGGFHNNNSLNNNHQLLNKNEAQQQNNQDGFHNNNSLNNNHQLLNKNGAQQQNNQIGLYNGGTFQNNHQGYNPKSDQSADTSVITLSQIPTPAPYTGPHPLDTSPNNVFTHWSQSPFNGRTPQGHQNGHQIFHLNQNNHQNQINGGQLQQQNFQHQHNQMRHGQQNMQHHQQMNLWQNHQSPGHNINQNNIGHNQQINQAQLQRGNWLNPINSAAWSQNNFTNNIQQRFTNQFHNLNNQVHQFKNNIQNTVHGINNFVHHGISRPHTVLPQSNHPPRFNNTMDFRQQISHPLPHQSGQQSGHFTTSGFQAHPVQYSQPSISPKLPVEHSARQSPSNPMIFNTPRSPGHVPQRDLILPHARLQKQLLLQEKIRNAQQLNNLQFNNANVNFNNAEAHNSEQVRFDPVVNYESDKIDNLWNQPLPQNHFTQSYHEELYPETQTYNPYTGEFSQPRNPREHGYDPEPNLMKFAPNCKKMPKSSSDLGVVGPTEILQVYIPGVGIQYLIPKKVGANSDRVRTELLAKLHRFKIITPPAPMTLVLPQGHLILLPFF